MINEATCIPDERSRTAIGGTCRGDLAGDGGDSSVRERRGKEQEKSSRNLASHGTASSSYPVDHQIQTMSPPNADQAPGRSTLDLLYHLRLISLRQATYSGRNLMFHSSWAVAMKELEFPALSVTLSRTVCIYKEFPGGHQTTPIFQGFSLCSTSVRRKQHAFSL